MGLQSVIDQSYWLVDVTFWLGFIIAYNSTKFKSDLKDLFHLVTQSLILSNEADVPMRMNKNFDLMTPRIAYNTIAALQIFAWLYHVVTLVAKESPYRMAPARLFYFVAPLLTLVSAHDILLHSTKKTWSEDVKRRHLLVPFELEGSRVFAEKLPPAMLSQQLLKTSVDIKTLAGPTFFVLVFTAIVYSLIPTGFFFFLTSAPIMFSYYYLLLFTAALQDYASLTLFRNKFDSFFGDLLSLIDKRSDDSKHEFFGRQFQYFNFCLKPLTPFLERHVFSPLRKSNFSVAESKAVYLLSRGLFVSFSLFLLGFLKLDRVPEVMGYYAVHSVMSYVNHDAKTDHFDSVLIRVGVMAVETIFAGFTFFKPVIESMR